MSMALVTDEAAGAFLGPHRVAHHLPSLFYVPDYLQSDEEERLLREAHASKAKWVQLSGRRLQNHGGVVHAKGLIPAPLPAWLRPLLERLYGQLGAHMYGGQPPNHVLVNSYQPGEGIMPHEDGPAYHPGVVIISLGAPAILRFRRKEQPEEQPQGPQEPDGNQRGCPAAQASAGASPPHPRPPDASVLLMPRSLVAFRDDAYTACLHSIDEAEQERCDDSVANLAACGVAAGAAVPRGGERVSLTVRRVARVLPSILRPRAT